MKWPLLEWVIFALTVTVCVAVLVPFANSLIFGPTSVPDTSRALAADIIKALLVIVSMYVASKIKGGGGEA
jgi:hypothetical protein